MPRMLIKPFRFALLLILACAAQCALAAPFALITILQGDATLLREEGKFQLAEGVALKAEDIVELSTKAMLLRIEYADGSSLVLGPASRVLIGPAKLTGDRAKTRAYLMAGWAKLSLAPGAEGTLASALADVTGAGARAVLGLSPGRAQVFAEGGEWKLRHAGGTIPMKTGDFVNVPASGKPEIAGRPSAEFMQFLPRPFMDTLPSRAQLFAGKEVPPKSIGVISYVDARDWLTVPEPALRRAELARWRTLSRDAEFRKALIENLSSHPEWDGVLFPSSIPSAARAASKP